MLFRSELGGELPLAGSLLFPVPALFSGSHFAYLVVEAPVGLLGSWRGIAENSAAVVLPPLDFERGQAVVRRCRAGRVFQAIDDLFCHVALLHFRFGRAYAAAEG